MRAHQAGQFPLPTIVHTLVAGVSAPVVGITRGVRYRIVSTQDCWFDYGASAVLQEGLYFPAKVPDYFAFGMSDPQGTDLVINAIAAFDGKVYFTPLRTVPTEG
jgi:hypothetical protein